MAEEKRRRPTGERVLAAAERLLEQGAAGFSMRELADAAGVSFATPFNQFGSKSAIMLALSERRIERMHDTLARATLPVEASARVLAAVDVATAIMLEAPDVNRAVMAALGAPVPASGPELPPRPAGGAGRVIARSGALWASALGDGRGLAPATRPLALAILPAQLAVAFRGVLSFWTAGELPDRELPPRARSAAAALLLGFATERARLVAVLSGDGVVARPPGPATPTDDGAAA